MYLLIIYIFYIFNKKVKCTLMNKSINIFKKIIDPKHLNKSKI